MQKDGRGNLYEALAAAQGEMENAKLNRVNPHFKSKYADLASIRDATIPALSKNGLAIIQFTELSSDGQRLILRTRLVHSSGCYLESEYPVMSALGDHHKTGSALTYAKRYSWSAMCGVSADEDDDGSAAQEKPEKTPQVSDKPWTGPLNKTALKEKMRALAKDLELAADEGTLTGVLTTYKEAIEQCERDLPDWFHHPEGNGCSQAIANKKAQLAQESPQETPFDA